MWISRSVVLGLRVAQVALLAGSTAPAMATDPLPGPTVVFVCEKGSAKSLMASEWFNRMAADRKLAVRSVGRGVVPDASVSPAMQESLRQDGFSVAGFTPRSIAPEELRQARTVVVIGVDPARLGEVSGATLEEWKDIPSPSKDYGASRDAMRARIEALLKTLAGTPPPSR